MFRYNLALSNLNDFFDRYFDINMNLFTSVAGDGNPHSFALYNECMAFLLHGQGVKCYPLV